MQTASQTAQGASQTVSRATQQPGNIVSQARSISTGQLVAGGVIVAELLGFFTVGEMIGRMKLIGYHGHGSAEHH
jgi:F-type H+-transporting ATPase subunit g